MILAILAATISLGLGGTASDGLGEQSASWDARVRVEDAERWWQAEAYYSPSDKIAGPSSRGGWLAGLSADWTGDRYMLAGLRYQHRVGPGWTKDRLWVRCGLHRTWDTVQVQALLDSALSSRDRETGMEGRVTLDVAPHIAIECVSRWILFDQGAYEPNRRVASLLSLRLLWTPWR